MKRILGLIIISTNKLNPVQNDWVYGQRLMENRAQIVFILYYRLLRDHRLCISVKLVLH